MRSRFWAVTILTGSIALQGCGSGTRQDPEPIPTPAIGKWQIRGAERAGLPACDGIDLGEGVKLEVVYIPQGSFLMGSPRTEELRYGDEDPRHPVTIPRGFYMARYEVTQQQYERVMGKNPSHPKAPDHPVGNLSWCDALTFCRRLRRQTGIAFRLPTEAEWEYACRAGSTAKYGFGETDERLAEHAWCRSNGEGVPHAVGRKQPNAWGVYDMHGNVWEWCRSVHRSYPYDDDDGRESMGALGERVLRGGSWSDGSGSCRSAGRLTSATAYADRRYGLRVVVSYVEHVELGGGVTMRMAYVPPGTFSMGSDSSPAHGGPPRSVTLSEGFYLGVCEVTQKQYEAVMGESPARIKGAALPVDSVSWHDAVAFCRKLSERSGLTFRLPTEAEWEYACRAGSEPAGGERVTGVRLNRVAWYASNSGGSTHPVGRKAPNLLGLFDMHGNVSEWCQTICRYYPTREKTGHGRPVAGPRRVLRGGSWRDRPERCLASHRDAALPSTSADTYGFRVVAVFE